MKLMTAEEIAQLKKEFDEEVDSCINSWAHTCFSKIEKQIKAKNTGVSKCIEGKIQIDPYRFYISRDLNDKIVDSNQKFHSGEYASNAMDIIKERVCYELEDCNFYKPFSFSGIQEMYRIINPDFGGGQYEMYFVPYAEVRVEKIMTGWIFKREKEIKKTYVTFKDNSLKLLKKLNKKCTEEGVELTGIEILYCHVWGSGRYDVDGNMIIDDIFGSREGVMPFGNCILLRWKYQM